MIQLRLVYVSTCARGLRELDVRQILDRSKANNLYADITGMLCWLGEFFLQCLEGPRDNVTRLFGRIVSDSRHEKVELIVAAPTAVRWFQHWQMGFTRELTSMRSDIGWQEGGTYDPYAIEATQLLDIFERLSQTARPMQT